MYVESEVERTEEAGKRADMKTLHEITRGLSGRFQSIFKPVRNEAGVLLNHEEPPNPSEVEPSDELNIRTGHFTRAEIKDSIKEVKEREGTRM